MRNFLAVALLVALNSANLSYAGLIKSYDFDGTFTDTLGNGVDIVASGGTLSGGRYSFANNQGLRLTNALPSTTDYGIELRFQVNDSVAGYNKLIDFQALASDIGLYVRDGSIDFYTAGPTGGSIALNTDYTVGLARSGSTIEVFLDGVSLFSVADSNQAVSAGNILNFFEDDNATSQRESFIGSVDWIRIHDDASTFGTQPVQAVPEPSSLLLFSLLGTLGLRLRRRKV
ncbi:MAG: PEP-CTERM sorting domain-containing protein [Pirellulaceae bacterium]